MRYALGVWFLVTVIGGTAVIAFVIAVAEGSVFAAIVGGVYGFVALELAVHRIRNIILRRQDSRAVPRDL